MSMTIGEQLARHFASLDYDGIPVKHTADARQLVLDYLGVAIAGSQRARFDHDALEIEPSTRGSRFVRLDRLTPWPLVLPVSDRYSDSLSRRSAQPRSPQIGGRRPTTS